MHEFVFYDGQLMSAADVALPAISSAALYGKGIFTTVAIYGGKPFLWEKHWYRLTENAVKLGIDISEISELTLRNSLDAIISNNSVSKGRARVTIFDTSPGSPWDIRSAQKTRLLITTDEPRAIEDEFRLTVSPYPVNSGSPLAGVKSCNYFENLLALTEARNCGHNEAIRLNERGEIVSACMANVFWQKDGKLFTPSLKTGCLAGTTREFVLENAECSEVEKGLETLKDADAVFVTSAGIGIIAASGFDERTMTTEKSRITTLLPPG